MIAAKGLLLASTQGWEKSTWVRCRSCKSGLEHSETQQRFPWRFLFRSRANQLRSTGCKGSTFRTRRFLRRYCWLGHCPSRGQVPGEPGGHSPATNSPVVLFPVPGSRCRCFPRASIPACSMRAVAQGSHRGRAGDIKQRLPRSDSSSGLG